jgi:hypothetical protein
MFLLCVKIPEAHYIFQTKQISKIINRPKEEQDFQGRAYIVLQFCGKKHIKNIVSNKNTDLR